MTTVYSSVLVRLPGKKERMFQACTADEFEHGVLTITENGTERVRQVFRRRRWHSATVYDVRGYPTFELNASTVSDKKGRV
jgi:hypothetical protein